MSKPNKKHNERCKTYKAQGRREINKEIKQERHKKRIALFAKRREEGKTYVYKPNPYDSGTPEHEREKEKRAMKHKNKTPLCEFQYWNRIFGRVNRHLQLIQEQEHLEEMKKKGGAVTK